MKHWRIVFDPMEKMLKNIEATTYPITKHVRAGTNGVEIFSRIQGQYAEITNASVAIKNATKNFPRKMKIVPMN